MTLRGDLPRLPDNCADEDMTAHIELVNSLILQGFWASNTTPGEHLDQRRRRATTEIALALRKTIPTHLH